MNNYLERYHTAGDINELDFLNHDCYLAVQVTSHAGRFVLLTSCTHNLLIQFDSLLLIFKLFKVDNAFEYYASIKNTSERCEKFVIHSNY